jgi:hypothetical protein
MVLVLDLAQDDSRPASRPGAVFHGSGFVAVTGGGRRAGSRATRAASRAS